MRERGCSFRCRRAAAVPAQQSFVNRESILSPRVKRDIAVPAYSKDLNYYMRFLCM